MHAMTLTSLSADLSDSRVMFLLLLLAALEQLEPLGQLGQQPAPDAVLIDSSRSKHTRSMISVVDAGGLRMMLSNASIIGIEYTEPALRSQAVFAGMALMQVVAFANPAPRRALALGLGVGTVPQYLRAAGIYTDVVEHDEAVVALAGKHFLFGESGGAGGRVIRADALRELGRALPSGAQPAYDLVLVDLWDGSAASSPPLHLRYVSSLKAGWLAAGGVLALNFVGFHDGPHAALAVRAVRTLAEAFRHVRVFCEEPCAAADPAGGGRPTEPSAQQPGPLNLLAVGSDAPLRFDPPARDAAQRAGTVAHLHSHFEEWAPARLAEAAARREGEVLEAEGSWSELRAELEAVRAAMRAAQRGLLPEAGWALVEMLLEEDEGAEEGGAAEEAGERADAAPTMLSSSRSREEL